MIDASKLKRDYIKYPLKRLGKSHKLEYPYKEDIEYLYIDLNMSIKELSQYFNVSKYPIINILKYYNISKPLDLIIAKSYDTQKKLYNGYYFQSNQFQKIAHKSKSNSWKKHHQESCMEKYGVENVFQLDTVKKSSIDSCLKKYGVEHYTQSLEYKNLYNNASWNNDIQSKKNKTLTKRLTKSYTSNEENDIYNRLKNVFPKTLTQYYSETYPWKCDFYIPEIDTYIEYQGHWTHGNKPFVNDDKLNLWKQKLNEGKKGYKRAIETWTIEDPKKRKWAKEHNLHWLEFFTINDFNIWFDKIQKKIG